MKLKLDSDNLGIVNLGLLDALHFLGCVVSINLGLKLMGMMQIIINILFGLLVSPRI